MAARNCPICNRIFEDLGVQDVCANCFTENETDINKVRDYLYLHPNNSIFEVSEATGISIQKLKRFLQSERLISVEKTSL
jgi:uncharacterized protein